MQMGEEPVNLCVLSGYFENIVIQASRMGQDASEKVN